MTKMRLKRWPTDSHLTYISAGPQSYDVYGPDRGVQLGRVGLWADGWVAESFDGSREGRAKTRWEAAVMVWPDSGGGCSEEQALGKAV